MKNEGLAFDSTQQVTENRAQRCQNSGQPRSLSVRIVTSYRRAQARYFMTSRLLLSILLFVGFHSVLSAQFALGAETAKGSWSDLNRLKAGQGIEVIESRMQRHAGRFVDVTDELLLSGKTEPMCRSNGKTLCAYQPPPPPSAASMP